jgi:hypothetical protein
LKEYVSDTPPLHPLALLDLVNAVTELERLAVGVCDDLTLATESDKYWDAITIEGALTLLSV